MSCFEGKDPSKLSVRHSDLELLVWSLHLAHSTARHSALIKDADLTLRVAPGSRVNTIF